MNMTYALLRASTTAATATAADTARAFRWEVATHVHVIIPIVRSGGFGNDNIACGQGRE